MTFDGALHYLSNNKIPSKFVYVSGFIQKNKKFHSFKNCFGNFEISESEFSTDEVTFLNFQRFNEASTHAWSIIDKKR